MAKLCQFFPDRTLALHELIVIILLLIHDFEIDLVYILLS